MAENERRFTPVQRCGHCGNSVSMEIVASHAGTDRDNDAAGSNLSRERGIVYEMLSCPVCQAVTLRSYYWHDRMLPSEIRFRTLYPGTGDGPIGLADSSKRTYSVARRFRTIDANAYRVMLRRLAIIHECNKKRSV